MTDFRQDTRLLAEICGEYVTHRDTGWRKVVVSNPDLGSLVVAAEQHGVLPLVARAVSAAGIACETARARARKIAFGNLALAAELVKLIDALEALGIEVLAYKGPALAQQLYGDATLRQFRDLDILVAPADVLRTRDALCRLGYRESEPFNASLLRKHVASQCEWPMMGSDSGTVIELHWALFPRYASLDLSVAELSRASVKVAIAGEPVRSLAPHHLALVLAAHGTKHFWYRLGWLVDFALVLRDCADADAARLIEGAARRGMRRIVLTSAALANSVLGINLTEAFDRAISGDASVRMLADHMERCVFSGIAPEDLLTENVLFLRSRERWSDRVKMVSRLAFTPGPEEWRVAAFPEWAEWLYRPLRVARAARYVPRILQRALSFRKS